MVYAATTKVSVDQSRFEIERTLKRYGADQFTYACDDEHGRAAIQFRAKCRIVRFMIRLPTRDNDKSLRRRTSAATDEAVEQAGRSIWRALLICVKAKLESVESKIETFEEAFMAHVVMPDGQTASEWLSPQIALAHESGKMPKTLLALPGPDKNEAK